MAVTAVPGWAQVNLETVLDGMTWREIGPTIMGGRVADLAVVESNPSVFYVATATGGLWKTTNHGTTFTPLFDDQPTPSIGDVTLAPSNPNVIWVGSGEPQNRQSSPWGMGVFRSVDAGRTWEHLGLDNTHHIARIVVHPDDPDVAFVAAMGHLWGPNPERGVYRTQDGGASWERVLFIDDNTGAIDLAMDPHDPNTLLAAMYQRQRTGFGFNGGGPGSGVYRTVDGGATWQEMTDGLPDRDMGRIGLDFYRGNSDVVYAIVEADPRDPRFRFTEQPLEFGGVFRSLDRGVTWERMSGTNNRPMYYSQVRVDPSDPERIYLGGASLYRSSDGGKTFTADAAGARGSRGEVHLDHHALWIDPANSDHMILGGDGGVSVTWDRGEHWRQLRNLPIAQFYEIGFDMRDPYYVCGGLQDNGSWCAPSNTQTTSGIRTKDWYNIGGGDGFFTVIDPDDPMMVYHESQTGNLALRNLATMERLSMRPALRNPSEAAEQGGFFGPSYRFNWNAPIVLSVHDRNTVYIGANHLMRSRDRGWTWEEASGDLTKAIDRNALEIMGRPLSDQLLSKNDGISNYGNITSLSESPRTPDLLYVGTDDGNVHVTRDGGATWTDITGNFRGVPERTYVSHLAASRFDEGTVYAAFDGHRNDDFAPYVFVSTDYGRRWRAITAGLPDGSSINVVTEHHRNANLLFVGNEHGVWLSIDRGEQWLQLDGNLPTVPVDDIQVHPRDNDLVIGTHGRGIWIMDDIGVLEELATAAASDVHLFAPRRATLTNVFSPQEWTPGVWQARNPQTGARISYHLTEAAPEGEVTITIRGADGEVVRELDGGGDAGLHHVRWDLRYPRPYVPARGQAGGFFGPPRGPRVLPGTYRVALTAGDVTREAALDVRLDPRVEITDDDLQARQDALMSAHRLAKPVYDAGRALATLREQVGEVRELLENHPDATDELVADVRDLSEALGTLASGMQRASTRAGSSIESYHARPTADQLWSIERAWEAAPGLIEQLNVFITERLPALNTRLNELGIRPPVGEPVEVPTRP
jgi:photosystem II stability/assembly factor-like uncharacterized protein